MQSVSIQQRLTKKQTNKVFQDFLPYLAIILCVFFSVECFHCSGVAAGFAFHFLLICLTILYLEDSKALFAVNLRSSSIIFVFPSKCQLLTLLACSIAFLDILQPGVRCAGKLPFPFCCSYSSVQTYWRHASDSGECVSPVKIFSLCLGLSNLQAYITGYLSLFFGQEHLGGIDKRCVL